VNQGSNLQRASERIGLCADCVHMRTITSAKGSVFYQCGLAATDARFPKYPRLPVLQCSGYKPNAESGSAKT